MEMRLLHAHTLCPTPRKEKLNAPRNPRNLVLGVILFSIASCKAKPDEKQAIRTGVMNHLNTRKSLNISAMDIDVTQTTINGNQAQAQVDFRLKNSAPGGPGMQVNYNLEKRGEDWVVIRSEPSGGNLQHPASGETPPGTALPPGEQSGC